MPAATSARAKDPARNVLVLIAETAGIDDKNLIEKFESSLRSRWPSRIQFYVEDVDPSRFSAEAYQRELPGYLRTKHAGRVDLVVVISRSALGFFQGHRDLFRGVPVLFAGSAEGVEELTREGLTGILIRPYPARTVDLALRLQPDTSEVVIVGGVAAADRRAEQHARRELAPLASRLTLTSLTDLPFSEVVARVQTLPRHTIVFYTRLTRDVTGTAFASAEALQSIRRAARVPIYGCSRTYVGLGLVGGVLVDQPAIGTSLGVVASRLLAGEPASALPPVIAEGSTVFDERELRRFGFDESLLPKGATIEFRQPAPRSWWELPRYVRYILLVVAGAAALAVALLTQRRQRQRVQKLLLDQQLFQKNFADLSTTFVTVAPQGIDTAMRGALHRILERARGDWAIVYEPSDPSEGTWKARFSEVRPGSGVEASAAEWDPERSPWLISRLRAGQVVTFLDGENREQLTAAAPGSAVPESAVVVPLAVGPSMVGVLWFIWFQSKRPKLSKDLLVERFRLYGELFANVIRRNEIESRLAETRDLNAAILASLILHVAVIDRNGTIIAVNDTWTNYGRAKGVRSECAIGPGANYLDVARRGGDEGAPLAREAFEGIRAVCEGRRDLFSLEYECSSESEQQWFLMTVVSLRRPGGGAVITHRDITESKLNETAIRESEVRFRRLADALPVGVWMSDTDGGRTYFNRAWLDFTGGPLERQLGEGWTDGLHPDDRLRYLNTYRSAAAAREPFSMEYRVRRRDGVYGWFVDSAVPRYGADGSFHGMVGGCLDVTDRKEAEDALRDLTGRVITAEEEDRRRIARDLHDGVNQLVALLAIEIEQLGLTPATSESELAERTHVLWKRTAEISSELHRLSHALHPSRLETFGLVAAIDAYCGEITQQQQVRVIFSHDDVPARIPRDTALCAFRIVQEALRNVVRHSGADEADVELSGHAGRLVLRVSDSGRGFDVTRKKAGLGLVSMSERVRFAGGELTIASSPGQGTQVHVELPLISGRAAVGALASA